MKKLFTSFLCLIVGLLSAADASLNLAERMTSQAGNFNPGTLPQTDITQENLQSTLNPSVMDTYRDIFGNSIMHLSQQRGAVLLPFVQMKGMVATKMSINRVGALPNPNQYTSRGSTVQPSNPESDVRWLIARRFWQACYVNNFDQLRTLWDIKNAYTEALSLSFGRLYDRVIIQAALGTACAGPNATTPVALPSSQRMVSISNTPSATGNYTLKTLRTVRRKMKRNFAVPKGAILAWAITANETDRLLGEEQVTSRDFTSVLTLMGGEVSAFLGFAFVETELLVHNTATVQFNTTTGQILPTTAGNLPAGQGRLTAGQGIRTFCFVQNSALCFGMNQSVFARISEMPYHHYDWQLYYAAEIGATRNEEVQVLEVISRDADVA